MSEPSDPKPSYSRPSHRVATAEQAVLLLDVELRKVLALLMKRACSATELARDQGVNVQKAHYLLGKLEGAGIAELDSLRPRAGRAVKRYRAAPRWFVPFEVTGAETLEAFLGAQILPRMQSFVRLTVQQIEATYIHWGFWLEQEAEASSLRMGDPEGAALALYEGDDPFLLTIGTLWLSAEQASALKQRLNAVVAEFSVLQDLSQTPHTIGLLLARGEVG
jgi:hypothetical protein